MSVVGFNAGDARVLTQMIDHHLAAEHQTNFRGTTTTPLEGPFIHVAKTRAGGVPARSGTTLGSAYVDVHSSIDGKLVDKSLEILAYNIASSAVAGEVYIVIGLSGFGDWLVLVEDCGS